MQNPLSIYIIVFICDLSNGCLSEKNKKDATIQIWIKMFYIICKTGKICFKSTQSSSNLQICIRRISLDEDGPLTGHLGNASRFSA